MSEKQQFRLELGSAGELSAESLDAMSLSLAEELRQLPQVEVERATGAPPGPGEKSVAGLANDLIVQIAGSAITLALPPLVGVVRDWMGRQPVTTGAITISCNGVAMEIAPGTPIDDVTQLLAQASKGVEG